MSWKKFRKAAPFLAAPFAPITAYLTYHGLQGHLSGPKGQQKSKSSDVEGADVSSIFNPSKKMGSDAWLEAQFAQSGLDPKYRNEWMSNPYWKQYNDLQKRNPGFGSLVQRAWNGYSKLDQDILQAKTNALAYQNDLFTRYYEDNYNSPENQAALESKAGINPNLQGIGDVAESVGNPEPAFDSPLSDASGSLSDFVNPILEIAQTYLSLKTGFANLKQIGLQNDNLASSNLSSIADFARAAALDSIQPSDFDNYKADNKTFLNGIIEQSQSLATNFFGDDYPNYKTARKIFQNTFNQHRSSVFANYKSWDEYSKIRGSQRDTAVIDNDMSNGITLASQNLMALRTQIDAFYADAEAKMMTADGFKELIQEKMFSGIMSDIQRNYANVEEDTYREDLWSEVNSEGVANEQAAAMKQEAIARMKEALAAQKIADIKKSDALVVQAFNDYMSSNTYKRTISYYDTGTTQRHQYEQSHNRLYGSDPFVEYHPVTWNDVKTLMMLGLNRRR